MLVDDAKTRMSGQRQIDLGSRQRLVLAVLRFTR